MALALLNLPPVTPAHIEEAVTRLERLASRAESAPYVAQAGFVLIHTQHQLTNTLDDAAAVSRYREWARRFPNDFFGQYALLNAATISLVATDPSPTIDDVTNWYAHASTLSDLRVRRNYLKLLSDTVVTERLSDVWGLQLTREALEIKFDRWDIEELMLIRAQELAHRLGDLETERAMQQRFVGRFPRRPWTQVFASRLEESRP